MPERGRDEERVRRQLARVDVGSLTLADLAEIDNSGVRSAIAEIMRTIDVEKLAAEHTNHMKFNSHMQSALREGPLRDNPL